MEETQQDTSLEQFLDTATMKLNQELENNLTLRMKYPSQTHRFYPSEEAIHELLTKFVQLLDLTQLQALKLLELIINTKIGIPLLKILEHPNADINNVCVSVIHVLIVEMGKQIEGEEKQKQGKQENQKVTQQAFALYFRLCNWLVENGLLQSLLMIWERLNQESVDQYEGCFKILKIIEVLLDLVDSSAPILIQETKIVELLANRILPNFKISHKTIDDNKFVASDLLLALLQTTPIQSTVKQQPQIQMYTPISGVQQFMKCCGMEILVETISSYEKSLPQEIDERQFLSNLFDCINVMLVNVKQSRHQFHSLGGNYLMVSYICTKTEFAVAALKAVSNSLIETQNKKTNQEIANRIIEDGSIKYLFSILMGQGIKGNELQEQQEINQHILSIIYGLIKNSEGVSAERVLYKLTEKRFGKLERIFEIRTENSQELGKDSEIQMSPQNYLRMLKQEKLGIVELCDKCIVSLFEKGNKKMREKIQIFMGLYHIPAEALKFTIETNYKFIDNGAEKLHIQKLLAGPLRQLLQKSAK